MPLGLAHEAQHLGMAPLAVDDDLGRGLAGLGVAVIGGVDALLQLEHHGAGGIDDVDAVAARGFVGLRRLAVGTQQHLHVVQLLELVVGDGLQADVGQAVHLGGVVHDVAQAVQVPTLVEHLLGLADRCRHSEAES